jgi:hypothetical protein
MPTRPQANLHRVASRVPIKLPPVNHHPVVNHHLMVNRARIKPPRDNQVQDNPALVSPRVANLAPLRLQSKWRTKKRLPIASRSTPVILLQVSRNLAG